MSSSIFWHDYETTGINPRCDRPLQVAGVRTDFDLNEIEEPISLYCRPSYKPDHCKNCPHAVVHESQMDISYHWLKELSYRDTLKMVRNCIWRCLMGLKETIQVMWFYV